MRIKCWNIINCKNSSKKLLLSKLQ